MDDASGIGTSWTGANLDEARIARIHDFGVGVLRYGIVFLLVVLGAAKYVAFGAKPLVEHSPLLSWMLGAFGVHGTGAAIGTAEIAIGVAIASRPIAPVVSALGSLVGVGMFLTTLSFLFSTPGALSLRHPASAFLLKDVVLLGACLATAAEALGAARSSAARRTRAHAVPARRIAP